MNKKNKHIYLFLFVILVVFIGFLREHIFVSINLRIQQIYYNSNENAHLIPKWVSIINELNYKSLLNLKWILTLMFVSIYWLAGKILFKLLLIEKKLISIFSITTIALLGFSLLIFVIGDFIFGKQYMGYEIARNITGFLQSPLPILIFYALFYSLKKQQLK